MRPASASPIFFSARHIAQQSPQGTSINGPTTNPVSSWWIAAQFGVVHERPLVLWFSHFTRNVPGRDGYAASMDTHAPTEDATFAGNLPSAAEDFRPGPAKIEAVLATLGGDSALDRINYLERNPRLVQVIGAGRDRVKFALDPLAEYLAGLYVIEHYGADEQMWRDFLAKVDSVPDAPRAIKGFLLAVRDCCLTPDAQREVPSFVAIELTSRAGSDIRRTETGAAV